MRGTKKIVGGSLVTRYWMEKNVKESLLE